MAQQTTQGRMLFRLTHREMLLQVEVSPMVREMYLATKLMVRRPAVARSQLANGKLCGARLQSTQVAEQVGVEHTLPLIEKIVVRLRYHLARHHTCGHKWRVHGLAQTLHTQLMYLQQVSKSDCFHHQQAIPVEISDG